MDLLSFSFLLIVLLFAVLAGGIWVAITLAIIGFVATVANVALSLIHI